jgi:hypothetical protein
MSADMGGAYPPLPAPFKIPTYTTTETGEVTIPPSTPFYYAGISSQWIYWQVDLAVCAKYLEPLGLVPASVGGKGLVNINFFNAAALYGVGFPGNAGVGGFNETEVNIVAYPKQSAGKVPDLSLEEYLTNGDQTKRTGNYRLWVACDNQVAVNCGIAIYLENKFLVDYTYNVPALNNPGVAISTWTCHDHQDHDKVIYTATVNLAGLTPTPGNMSEWIDLSYDKATKRIAGSRRNYFGMHDTYMLSGSTSAVEILFGQSAQPMKTDMERLIGSADAVAVQLFRSAPCIAEARPYWADT